MAFKCCNTVHLTNICGKLIPSLRSADPQWRTLWNPPTIVVRHSGTVVVVQWYRGRGCPRREWDHGTKKTLRCVSEGDAMHQDEQSVRNTLAHRQPMECLYCWADVIPWPWIEDKPSSRSSAIVKSGRPASGVTTICCGWSTSRSTMTLYY